MDIIKGVYVIRNIITQEVYVGSSINIKKRIKRHRGDLKRGNHANPHLQKSWNEHGSHNFDFSIQEVCIEEKLIERESHWIKFYESLNPYKGFNYSIPDNSRVPRQVIKKVRAPLCKYICINIKTNEKLTLDRNEIIEKLLINKYAISEITSYWRGRLNVGKTNKGWIIVNHLDYKEDFDYINYDKLRDGRLPVIKVKSYAKTKTLIPYAERNIFRRSILMKKVETGEEEIFPSISEAVKKYKLVHSKVGKCLSREFGKNTHRGYYYKYL